MRVDQRLRGLAVIAFLGLAAEGCGDKPVTYVNPEAKPYVDTFLAQAEIRGESLTTQNLIVDYRDKLPLVNGLPPFGMCNQKENGQNEVLLSRPYWDATTESQRETLVFHELGHCLLNRTHVNSIGSLMWPHSDEVAPYFQTDPTAYLDELFKEKAPAGTGFQLVQ